MRKLEELMAPIIMLAMATELMTTPEQREAWARDADWNYYASKYAD